MRKEVNSLHFCLLALSLAACSNNGAKLETKKEVKLVNPNLLDNSSARSALSSGDQKELLKLIQKLESDSVLDPSFNWEKFWADALSFGPNAYSVPLFKRLIQLGEDQCAANNPKAYQSFITSLLEKNSLGKSERAFLLKRIERSSAQCMSGIPSNIQISLLKLARTQKLELLDIEKIIPLNNFYVSSLRWQDELYQSSENILKNKSFLEIQLGKLICETKGPEKSEIWRKFLPHLSGSSVLKLVKAYGQSAPACSDGRIEDLLAADLLERAGKEIKSTDLNAAANFIKELSMASEVLTSAQAKELKEKTRVHLNAIIDTANIDSPHYLALANAVKETYGDIVLYTKLITTTDKAKEIIEQADKVSFLSLLDLLRENQVIDPSSSEAIVLAKSFSKRANELVSSSDLFEKIKVTEHFLDYLNGQFIKNSEKNEIALLAQNSLIKLKKEIMAGNTAPLFVELETLSYGRPLSHYLWSDLLNRKVNDKDLAILPETGLWDIIKRYLKVRSSGKQADYASFKLALESISGSKEINEIGVQKLQKNIVSPSPLISGPFAAYESDLPLLKIEVPYMNGVVIDMSADQTLQEREITLPPKEVKKILTPVVLGLEYQGENSTIYTKGKTYFFPYTSTVTIEPSVQKTEETPAMGEDGGNLEYKTNYHHKNSFTFISKAAPGERLVLKNKARAEKDSIVMIEKIHQLLNGQSIKLGGKKLNAEIQSFEYINARHLSELFANSKKGTNALPKLHILPINMVRASLSPYALDQFDKSIALLSDAGINTSALKSQGKCLTDQECYYYELTTNSLNQLVSQVQIAIGVGQVNKIFQELSPVQTLEALEMTETIIDGQGGKNGSATQK